MYLYTLWLAKAVNIICEQVTERFICFRQSKENVAQAVEALLLHGCKTH